MELELAITNCRCSQSVRPTWLPPDRLRSHKLRLLPELGYSYRGVIFPTLRNSFKSRDLERLYQRYFLGQRRKSVVVMNLLDLVTKLTLLVLHLTLASTRMDPVVVCALVVVRKDAASHSYLQYSGVVTWVVMTTQILSAGLGYGLLGDGVGYVLFTLFATYSMLPLPLTWAIVAGLLTSSLHILVQMFLSRTAKLSTNQVRPPHSQDDACVLVCLL
ncbi:hypothetical protein WMY93_000009 [Mugilogobius chulae]|uniref:Adenylate cyclase N-terminal domain-containing protein n=1 Tax=Mugilogobius chulae TaxID=88201 RepID=A0AAW0PXN0_9GOBI